MVNNICSSANIPCRETAFLQQPDGVYAIWGEKITAEGSDYSLDVLVHEVTVELYEPPFCLDESSRNKLIEAMDMAYIEGEIGNWNCEMRVWIEDVQLFMTTFNFSYLERR